MILGEHFYVAVCFTTVLGVLYKKAASGLNAYLESQVGHISSRILEAQDLKNQAVEALQEARSNLAEMILIKEKKINQARIDSARNVEDYKSQTDINIAIMRAEQDRYFANLQEEFLCENKLKILDLASKKIIQEVEDKKVSFEAAIH